MAKELKRHRKWRLANDAKVVYYFLVFILVNVFFPFIYLLAAQAEMIPHLVGLAVFLGILVAIRFFNAKDKFEIQSVFTTPQSSYGLIEETLYTCFVLAPIFFAVFLIEDLLLTSIFV